MSSGLRLVLVMAILPFMAACGGSKGTATGPSPTPTPPPVASVVCH
jgi:hypothetical protein